MLNDGPHSLYPLQLNEKRSYSCGNSLPDCPSLYKSNLSGGDILFIIYNKEIVDL